MANTARIELPALQTVVTSLALNIANSANIANPIIITKSASNANTTFHLPSAGMAGRL